MKLLAITFAAVLALASSACVEKSIAELTELKCSHSLVFSGTLSSGTSSIMAQDPDHKYTFRRDQFNVNEAFRGSPGSSQLIISVTPVPSPCGGSPFGGSNALVFARLNTTYNTYQVDSCSYQPDISCVDVDAFRDILC